MEEKQNQGQRPEEEKGLERLVKGGIVVEGGTHPIQPLAMEPNWERGANGDI